MLVRITEEWQALQVTTDDTSCPQAEDTDHDLLVPARQHRVQQLRGLREGKALELKWQGHQWMFLAAPDPGVETCRGMCASGLAKLVQCLPKFRAAVINASFAHLDDILAGIFFGLLCCPAIFPCTLAFLLVDEDTIHDPRSVERARSGDTTPDVATDNALQECKAV